jgi:uncharacterized membrane protein YgdD (TMEM256/DUF423 family)
MTPVAPPPSTGAESMNRDRASTIPFRLVAAAGAFSAGAAVALGAFGAHGLRTLLTPEMLAVYETAVRYQMYHAFALLAAGLFGRSARDPARRLLLAAAWAFGAGTLLFSGSLYALALTGMKTLGAVTPFGGIAFLAGWIVFGLALLRREQG